jgi:hypothetical protein
MAFFSCQLLLINYTIQEDSNNNIHHQENFKF